MTPAITKKARIRKSKVWQIPQGIRFIADSDAETLNLYVYNVHCKHIIFGASADNSYASFLGSFHDIDVATRIRLLEGPPFAIEFKTILPRFKQLRFPEIFRSTKIDITQRQHFSTFKKSDVDAPTRKAADTSAFTAANVERLINQSLPDRTVQPSPIKPKHNMLDRPASPTKPKHNVLDRPASPTKPSIFTFRSAITPTKNVQDTANGGVSLTPHQQSTDTAALRRLLGQVGQVTPKTESVEKALIKATLETLLETPRACDFANVKRRAETKLGVDATIWGSSEDDFWFTRSKRIIKWTVEMWLELTNNPLPGNATWMFKHFPAGKSTSSVLRKSTAQEWRTPGEPEWRKIFDRAVVSMDIS